MNGTAEKQDNIVSLISRRRRQILVHSFMYYQLNTNIISDYTFDEWSRDLVKLQEKYPEEAKQAVYHKEFISFDGSSGYDLPYSYPEIQGVGFQLLEYPKKRQS